MIRWLLLIPIACAAWGQDRVQFTAHAEGIYWKPTTGGLDLAIMGNQVEMVKPDNHWGVRGAVGVVAPWSCTQVLVGGLFIQSDDSHRAVGAITNPPFDIALSDEIVGRLRFKYWNINAECNYTLFSSLCVNMALLGGARYVEINQRQNVRTTDLASLKYRYRGVGPGLGLQGNWSVWQGFHISAHLYVMTLIGPRLTSFQNPQLTARYPDATTVVPAADLAILLSYSLDWGGFLATVSLGYDLQQFWQATNHIPQFGENVWRFRSPQNVGFAGPSVRLGVRW